MLEFRERESEERGRAHSVGGFLECELWLPLLILMLKAAHLLRHIKKLEFALKSGAV